MSKNQARKGQRRVKFIEDILHEMKNHDTLRKTIKRNSKDEKDIQDAVFSTLDSRLPAIISDHYDISIKASKKKVRNNFNFEKKSNCAVSNFPFFGTNHRPDADLSIYGTDFGFEIKKGSSGGSIRNGIGQSIVYSTQFDFVIYFFVDTSKGRNIKNVTEGDKESNLVDSLWNSHNIRFVVV